MTKTLLKPALAKFALAAGAISLSFAPVAANAGTRAGDNAPVYSSANSSTQSQPGIGRAAEGEQLGAGAPVYFILAAILGTWATVFIAKSSDVLFDDEEEDDGFQSAGV